MPPFKFVDSPSSYASRISAETWQMHEPEIRTLHAAGKNRTEIRQILTQKRGFNPSAGQLTKQYAKWGLTVYATKDRHGTDEEKQQSRGKMAPSTPYGGTDSASESLNDGLGLNRYAITEAHSMQLLDNGDYGVENITVLPDLGADADTTTVPAPSPARSKSGYPDCRDAKYQRTSSDGTAGPSLLAEITLSEILRPHVKRNQDFLSRDLLRSESWGVKVDTWSDEQMVSLANILRELGDKAAAFEILHQLLERKCGRNDTSDNDVLHLIIKCMLTAKSSEQLLAACEYTRQAKSYLRSTTRRFQIDRRKIDVLLDFVQKITDHIFASIQWGRGDICREAVAIIEENQEVLTTFTMLALDTGDYRDLLSAECMKLQQEMDLVTSSTYLPSFTVSFTKTLLVEMWSRLRKAMSQDHKIFLELLPCLPNVYYQSWILLYLQLLPAFDSDPNRPKEYPPPEAGDGPYMDWYAGIGVISRLLMPENLNASASFTKNPLNLLKVAEFRLTTVMQDFQEMPISQINEKLWNNILNTTRMDKQSRLLIRKFVCQYVESGRARPGKLDTPSMSIEVDERFVSVRRFRKSQADFIADYSRKVAWQRRDLEIYTARLGHLSSRKDSSHMPSLSSDVIPEYDISWVGHDEAMCPSLVSSDFRRFEESGIEWRQETQADCGMDRASSRVPSIISSLSAMLIDQNSGWLNTPVNEQVGQRVTEDSTRIFFPEGMLGEPPLLSGPIIELAARSSHELILPEMTGNVAIAGLVRDAQLRP